MVATCTKHGEPSLFGSCWRCNYEVDPRMWHECPLHPGTWVHPTIGQLANELPVPSWVATVCVRCYIEHEGDPLQSEVGLLEMPDYWRREDGGLRCEHHNRSFALTAACRLCVDEDASGLTGVE